MRVSGKVASAFVVSAALGEALLPVLIALAYPANHAAFPQIILAASAALSNGCELLEIEIDRGISWENAVVAKC